MTMTKNGLPLRMALAANAAFSSSCGLLMLSRPDLVGRWLGAGMPLVLQAIGISLLLFAADLVHQATRPRLATWRALYASVADLAWVAGLLLLAIFFPALLSPLGDTLLLAVAVIVLVFGAWQPWAIGWVHRSGHDGEYRHCVAVATDVPAETLWPAVGALGDIAHYMPSLKNSVILDGNEPGVGAIRQCEDRAGRRWAEQCTEFVPGRGFAVRFLADAPDFPFPARAMHGGWEILPAGAGSHVVVWWELTPKHAWVAPLLLPLLAFQADRDFPKIVRRMAASVSAGERAPVPMRDEPAATARLLPHVC